MSRTQGRAPDTVADWAAEPEPDALFAAQALFDRDPEQAIRKLEGLVVRGSVRSMVELGWRYSLNNSPIADFPKAEDWYRRAIEAGARDGPYLLGVLLQKLHRYDEAVELFRLGESWGHIPAMYRLGWMYYLGQGHKRDLEAARDVFRRASELGHVASRAKLISLYLSGRFGLASFARGFSLLSSIPALIIRINRRDRTSDLLRDL